jgi:hypothetical protein
MSPRSAIRQLAEAETDDEPAEEEDADRLANDQAKEHAERHGALDRGTGDVA